MMSPIDYEHTMSTGEAAWMTLLPPPSSIRRAPGLTARRERLGQVKTAAKLGFDQVDAPYRFDHLVDPRAAHPGIHLDHAGAVTGALGQRITSARYQKCQRHHSENLL
jgi:hypothetical protein